ncbi:hypothetical protein, conserved [Leishmania tarentolae]|uniref:Ankyrin repeat protein n=1 Tax=Leishmania tarentolae TaxID=5689 RepID=A0A640KII2_LEITA|nr:hypothetical protein, conserved [Leishmania tarentolae]
MEVLRKRRNSWRCRGIHESHTSELMRGVLAASRVLLRFLPPQEVEALLQSVLEHHSSTESPSAIVTADTIPLELRNEDKTPSFSLLSCLPRNPDNEVTEERAGKEASIASAVGGGKLKDPSRITSRFSQPQYQQQPDYSRGHAGKGTSTNAPQGQIYFTLEAVRTHPMISFPEILTQWEHFLELDGDRDDDYVSSHLSCSEMALLNIKLEDGLLASLAAMRGTPPPIDKVPKHVVDVLRSDFLVGDCQQAPNTLHAFRAPLSHRASKFPACYTLLHFSAELGDMEYVQALLSRYPSGFPLRWLSSPMRTGEVYPTPLLAVDKPASGVGFWPFSALSPRPLAMPLESGAEVCARTNTELYPSEWVSEHCPDHTGMYLCHLAAARGNVQYLDYLVGLLGAVTVLKEQRCARPASPLSTWGPLRYLPDLTAAQCALAFHQTAALEWIEMAHPFALEQMERRTLANALVAAAMHRDDLTGSFSFLRARSMEPLHVLDLVSTSVSASCAKVGASRPSQRVWSSELEEAGILHIVFAAAEAGNVGVLRWFDDALGATDIRWLCDRRGTTVLHHCARGLHTAAMEALLSITAAALSTVSVQMHGGALRSPLLWTPLDPTWIDVEDSDGRTPAVWCVFGRSRKGREVEILEVLRKAGSDWPRRRHNGLSLLEIAGQEHSHHTRLMRYLKHHIRAPLHCQGR